MNNTNILKIRVSEFAEKNGIDRQMIYYFIKEGKLDIVTEYGLKLIVLNERAESFLRQYKK